jgi:hypothetical protein
MMKEVIALSIDATEARPGIETREMRLISRALGERGPLSAYLAKRRTPGDGWLTWEQIVFELFGDTGETFTRAGLTNWAERYGIPVDSRPTDNADAFRTQLASAGLKI